MHCASSDAACPPSDTAPPPQLRLHRRGDPGRAEVEAFVARVFAHRFGAELREFAPCLVSLDEGDEIVAAAGYRRAGDGPLFLETYLDAPVEQLLAAAAGGPPQRPAIVEVGHLAATRAGQGRQLIRLLGVQLAAQGFQWVVGTLTEELRHLFVRLGVAPLALGRADPRLLGGAAQVWGSYYDHSPVVLAGYLPHALRSLARRPLAAVAAR